jgi:sarcosine oxidase
VLLLEQFEPDHQKGSSYGYSRIIRYSYDHPTYVQLAKATYPMWHALQEEAGETLLVQTGGLDFGTADEVRDTLETVQAFGLPHEVLSPRDAEDRFPQFRFNDNTIVLYQPDSGLLKASKCVRAHIRLAQQHSAIVLEQTPVTGIMIQPDGVRVTAANDTYDAGRLIITAGAWAKSLLASIGLNLPLQPLRCQEAHFQPDQSPERFTAEHMPVFIYHGTDERGFKTYGLPSVDSSGVKVAYHGGAPFEHPSQISYTPNENEVERIRKFSRQYLPVIGDCPLGLTRICLYTMTPDEHFIIDQHPEYPQIVVGSPCSGHGFKFSTMIGHILADLALTGRADQDISLFSVRRFWV